MENALIIFAKNPILGKVKTRLAKSIGDETALKVYKDFMNVVRNYCSDIEADIHWFYSDYILKDNKIDTKHKYKQYKQLQNKDLGIRMKDAFKNIFNQNYQRVVIIGVDCPYLNADLINEAFLKLAENSVVIGPANDGGFYLLGTTKFKHLDFSNIAWSTSSVFNTLIKNLEKQKLNPYILLFLDDIDDIDDYRKFIKICQLNE